MGDEREPAPLATVTTFYTRPFADLQFLEQSGKATQEIGGQKAPPPVLAFRLVNGGEPRITFVHPLGKWSDVSRIESSIRTAVESMGPDAAELARALRDFTVRSESSVLASRPDLSYEADVAKSLAAK